MRPRNYMLQHLNELLYIPSINVELSRQIIDNSVILGTDSRNPYTRAGVMANLYLMENAAANKQMPIDELETVSWQQVRNNKNLRSVSERIVAGRSNSFVVTVNIEGNGASASKQHTIVLQDTEVAPFYQFSGQ